jgi:ABC-2 type transport system permease protein
MRTVYLLTLRQLTGRWRLAIMTVLAALPVLVSLLIMSQSDTASVAEFEEAVLSAMLAGSIAPLVVLALSAAALGNEVDDRTLANLTLSPLSRWRIAVAKLLAALSIAAPFIAVSAGLTGWIAFLGDPRTTVALVVSALVGVALYTSVFVWLGLAIGQAVGVGLLYIVLWEGLFSEFVGGARLLSIRHYAIAVMHGVDPRRFAMHDHVPLAAALAVSAAVFGGFLWLTVKRLRTMDVP